jgi:hypothetical protein
MEVDVTIYVSNLKKFFSDNPQDLANLIPEKMFDEFFVKVEQIAILNFEGGKEIPLTRQQLIDLCVKLNGNPPKKGDEVFVELAYGKFFLN